MRREQPAHFSAWQHGVVPWVATAALLPVLFVTVYPLPAWPYNLTPYIFVVALVLGVGYMKWRESRDPGSLERAALMLTRGGTISE